MYLTKRVANGIVSMLSNASTSATGYFQNQTSTALDQSMEAPVVLYWTELNYINKPCQHSAVLEEWSRFELLLISVNKTVLKVRFDENINAEDAKMYMCSSNNT